MIASGSQTVESALHEASVQPCSISEASANGEAFKAELLDAIDILRDLSDGDLRDLKATIPLQVATKGTLF